MDQLTFGTALQPRVWWTPFCTGLPYDPLRFDLTECAEDSTLSLAPVVIVAIGAAVTASSLVQRYSAGDRPEKGGKGAYALKLVSRSRFRYRTRAR